MQTTTAMLQFLRDEITPQLQTNYKKDTYWSKIFRVINDKKYFQEMVGIQGIGLASRKYEGQAVEIKTARQDYNYTLRQVGYGARFGITKEMKMFERHESIAMVMAGEMEESFRQTKETIHAAIFNQAFSGSVTYGDGVALCSASHPSRAGLQSNILSTAISFSEAGIEAMLTQSGLLHDSGGKLMPRRPKALMVHPNKQFDAERILKSAGQASTANNAINVIKAGRYVPELIVNPYLSDPNAYFLLLDEPNGFQTFQAQPFDTMSYTDGSPDIAWQQSDEYYVPGCYATRTALIGTPGL